MVVIINNNVYKFNKVKMYFHAMYTLIPDGTTHQCVGSMVTW